MSDEWAPRPRPPRQTPILAPVPRVLRVPLPRVPGAALSAGAIAALVLATVYAVVAIAVVARRYDAFALRDPALPAYTQALWALLHGGEPTLLGASLLEGSLFARHLHVAILALIPPLAITSWPILLLAAQAIAVAAGAPALFAIGTRRLGGVAIPLALVAAYFLHPAVGFASVDRFRMTALAVPFLVGAHLAYLSDRRRALALCLAAAALVREDLAFFAVVYGVILLVRRRAKPLGLALIVGALAYPRIAVRLLAGTVDAAQLYERRWYMHHELVPVAMVALTEVLVLTRRIARGAAIRTAASALLLAGFAIGGALLSRTGGEHARLEVAPDAHLARMRRSLLDRIPRDVPIVASREIIPHVALRRQVYAFDRPRPAPRDAEGPRFFPDARYALVDWSDAGLHRHVDWAMAASKPLERAFGDGSWQVLYAADNLVLLHRPSNLSLASRGPNPSRPFAGEPQLYEALPETTQVPTPPLLLIDGTLELLDVRVVASPGSGEDRLRVAFFWRSTKPGATVTWFRSALDIIDQQGSTLASVTHPITYGIYQPAEWTEGQIVREDVWLALPRHLSRGSYHLAIRMKGWKEEPALATEPLSETMPAADDRGRWTIATWSVP